MFLFTIVSILLIIKKSFQGKDCISTIFPSRASECVLSREEKQIYNYCCFERKAGEQYGTCAPFDDSEYLRERLKQKYAQYGEYSYNFVCNDRTVSSSETYYQTPTRCDDISPDKPSDCVLSGVDKAYNYDYCCYVKIETFTYCTTVTKKEYKEGLDYLELNGLLESTTILCTDKEKGSGGVLNISIILLMLIILSI